MLSRLAALRKDPELAGVMLDLVYPLLRPLLFRLDAEVAHELALAAIEAAPGALGCACRLTLGPPPAALSRTVAGLALRGPVGLAAGLDKDGRGVTFWPHLGFGFAEIGTVTAHPQPGNPRPRLLRLPDERAIVNRMGFNNQGSLRLAERLRRLREADAWPDIPIGVNLGKSKVTPVGRATDDYVASARRLAGLADYLTVNVSSPNTPGLRSLQDRSALTTLLPSVLDASRGTPVFLKLAPDLDPEVLADLVELAVTVGASAVIACNTTLRRDVLRSDPREEGGLSGAPLWPVASAAIRVALRAAAGRIPVIGVGGIERTEQVEELLAAGCAAVQLYTALIYAGPGLPHRIHAELAARQAEA